MSLVNEIKCPHCEAWNQSTGMVDAKCANCSEYLEPARVEHEEEKRLAAARNENYYLKINDNDETLTQLFKIFVNSVRWSAYYAVMLFFIFVAGILLIVGIIAM
jgi:methionyl-tRNA synthetase